MVSPKMPRCISGPHSSPQPDFSAATIAHVHHNTLRLQYRLECYFRGNYCDFSAATIAHVPHNTLLLYYLLECYFRGDYCEFSAATMRICIIIQYITSTLYFGMVFPRPLLRFSAVTTAHVHHNTVHYCYVIFWNVISAATMRICTIIHYCYIIYWNVISAATIAHMHHNILLLHVISAGTIAIFPRQQLRICTTIWFRYITGTVTLSFGMLFPRQLLQFFRGNNYTYAP
jgi:hypothetical protein